MTYRHRIADWLRVLTAVILLFASVSVAEAQQNVAPAPVIVYQFTGNTGSLAITTTSANVALPTGTPTVYVTNPGPAAACVALGTSGAITAGPFSICPAAQVVPPNQTRAFGIGANTYIAGVADTGTATLTLLVGNFGPSATNGVAITGALPAGTNVIGKVGIDQTTQGTTNFVTQGSSDRQSSTPTVQNAAYSANNCVGGFNSITFQGTGPITLINDVRLASQGGGTESLTVYLFDQNPTGSTCIDKGTFTLASADTAKLVMAPFVMTPAAAQGATQTFASNPNLARIPKSGTTTLYYALVAGGTFTPATTSDLIVGIQVVQQHQ